MSPFLAYNPETGRMEIGEIELHCGDCFQLHFPKTNWPEPTTHHSDTPEWQDVRIEHSNGVGWHFVGLPPWHSNLAMAHEGREARFRP